MKFRSHSSFRRLLLLWLASLAIAAGCTVTTLSPEVQATGEGSAADSLPQPTPTPQAANIEIQTEGEAEIEEVIDAPEPVRTGISGQPAFVTAVRLNLRSGPGTTYQVLGQLSKADSLAVHERSEDGAWYRVCCLADKVTGGWVSGAFLVFGSEPPPPAATSTRIPFNPRSEDLSDAKIPDPHTLWEMTVETAFGHLPTFRFSHPPASAVNPLTGLPVAPERLQNRAMTVCIPSDVQARPQAGLAQADIVYEYLVDGDMMTRMTGIYFGEDVPLIGPIRSARLVNFHLGYLYNAAVMCSGASDHIRRLLREMADFPYFDIDLDNAHGLLPYSFLVGQGLTRFHTSVDGIRAWLEDSDREQPMDLKGFEFDWSLPSGGTPVSYLRIPYPASSRNTVEFRHSAESNSYLRFVDGERHMDRNSGLQIAPQNVIVQYVPHASTFLVEDALGSRSLDHDLFGFGPAFVFRDGLMYKGNWHTSTLGELMRFRTEEGGTISLHPGRSWIALVPEEYQLVID